MSLFLLVAATLLPVHLPHDDVHDVACGVGPNGAPEIVIAANSYSKMLRSVDHGLSWQILAGDGLEFRDFHCVEYWNHSQDRRYWIGTDDGVWSYHPGTGVVQRRADGLLPGDGFITDLAAPRRGDGPPALMTSTGSLYLWQEGSGHWQRTLATGIPDDFAQVALPPDFDPNGAAPHRSLFVATGRTLHRSFDGGHLWSTTTLAGPLSDPRGEKITELLCADDFATSGVVLAGSASKAVVGSHDGGGTLWRSDDFGASFVEQLALGSPPRAMAAAPPDAAGARYLYLAAQGYPDPADPQQHPGVLRSEDGGQSWSDFGNGQDFMLEDEDYIGGKGKLRFRVGLAVSPDFAQDGLVVLGRAAGFYRSRDAGHRWRAVSVRPPANSRELGVGLNAAGELIAYASTNGSGVMRANLERPEVDVLDSSPIHFARAVAVSSNHAQDGGVAVTGRGGLVAWFDPALPPANPFQRSGFVFQEGLFDVRYLVAHPDFDWSAPASGGSRTLFWTSLFPIWTEYSDDAGFTRERVETLSDGSPAPYMRRLRIAPTYDPDAPGGRTDVYSISQRWVFRFDNGAWEPLGKLPTNLFGMVIDPSYSRPNNPRLFVAELFRPVIHELIDDPTGPIANELDYPGLDSQVRSLALPPDFATNPVVYAAAWSRGAMKLDLSAPSPAWEPVGSGLPAVWTDVVQISPDFAQDQTVVIGTQDGVWFCKDQPGAVWQKAESAYNMDDFRSVLRYYEPNHPLNPQPDRPHHWETVERWDLQERYGAEVIGLVASYADTDGAAAEWEGYASKLELRSFRGPNQASVTLTAHDYWTGQLLATATEDLAAAGPLHAHRVVLDLPASAAVRFRAEATVQPGEAVIIDGLTVHP